MIEKIHVKRLRVGIYIHLRNISWMAHPFMTNRFMLETQADVDKVISTGVEYVYYDTTKSKTKPLEKEVKRTVVPFSFSTTAKKENASELRKRRQKFKQAEQNFNVAMEEAQHLYGMIGNSTNLFYDEAKEYCDKILTVFTDDSEVVIQYINASASLGGFSFHSINVMVLSLMLGKALELSSEEMENLAFGALCHDVGMSKLPKAITVKPKLTSAERKLLQQHPKLGVAALSGIEGINKEVMKIVYEHHERCDGTGYPAGKNDESISKLAQIVNITDTYDRIINPKDNNNMLSPHQALSVLYSRMKKGFNLEYLEKFIRVLGIYPPGTFCELDSGTFALIVGLDYAAPLNPEIIIYDPTVPKYEAVIHKLGVDYKASIVTTCEFGKIPKEVLDYFDFKSRIQYYPS